MIDRILQELETQLATYEAMTKMEWASTGGETRGTCVYLDGAVVASRRALETVRRVKADPKAAALQAARYLNLRRNEDDLEAIARWN